MLQNSPILQRNVSKSLIKLKKAASDHRFRIKSLRVKTIEIAQKQTNLEKDYQKQLIEQGITSQWLHNLYEIKAQESKLKISDIKYKAFIKGVYYRLINTNSLQIHSLNFQQQSIVTFLEYFIKWNSTFITINLSHCTEIPIDIIIKLIKNNKKAIKYQLNNMSLDHQSIEKILKTCLRMQRIFDIDLSNISSQSMNRFSENFEILQQFTRRNTTTAILKLDNNNLKKQGLQCLVKGIIAHPKNPIKILNLKNNAINQQSFQLISQLIKIGLTHLDISENPLGKQFFSNLPFWKTNTIKHLDISSTNMDSQSLIIFLSKIEQNKSITHLKLDKNDFSHHWFSQIRLMMQVNSSIEFLSMIDCNIKLISSLFEGLISNKYLKKLYISNNMIDEDINKICKTISQTKTLKDIKMRFCSIKQHQFIQIFKALETCQTLNSLDISQNALGQKGAKALIYSLNKNNTIQTITIEKVSISLRIKKQIEQKLKQNRQMRTKRQLIDLKLQNKKIKQKDIYTWQKLDELQQQIRKNEKTIKNINQKVGHLEQRVTIKKSSINQFVTVKKQEEKIIENQIKQINKKLNKKKKIRQNQIQLIQKQAAQRIEDQNIEKKLIQNLENKIRLQNQKIRKRQNQLEDIYKNKKYITNKKKQQKKIFDNTTSIINKKLLSNGQNF